MKKYAKIAALFMAFVLVIAGTVGVTMALLTDKTGPVTNTFTIGKVAITLNESPVKADGMTVDTTAEKVTTNTGYKLVPGNTLQKDPTVTVVAGSEACYLFIKVEVGSDLANVIDYTLDGWAQLVIDENPVANVYYKEVDAVTANAGKAYAVFTDNKVVVDANATKTEIDAATGETIVLTAYACQTANTTLKAAWTAVSALA